jgi:hypothetical protein
LQLTVELNGRDLMDVAEDLRAHVAQSPSR